MFACPSGQERRNLLIVFELIRAAFDRITVLLFGMPRECRVVYIVLGDSGIHVQSGPELFVSS